MSGAAIHRSLPDRRAGFTLLELLVAIALLAGVAAIVYASFAGVTNATEMARVDAEELREHRFLRRRLTQLFSSVYTDTACRREDYAFVGSNNTGRHGPADGVTFCSTDPMAGGLSLPGAIKRVTIELGDEAGSDQTFDDLDKLRGDEADKAMDEDETLRVVETMVVVTPDLGLDAGPAALAVAAGALGQTTDAEFYEPGWELPLRSMNITYFDGEEWLEDWDSIALGRMPWAVRVGVNFQRTEEELEEERAEGVRSDETADLDLVFPIAVGAGVYSEFIEPQWPAGGPPPPGGPTT